MEQTMPAVEQESVPFLTRQEVEQRRLRSP